MLSGAQSSAPCSVLSARCALCGLFSVLLVLSSLCSPCAQVAAYQERLLVIEGQATLSPDDCSAAVSIGPGDVVVLMRGFSCSW